MQIPTQFDPTLCIGSSDWGAGAPVTLVSCNDMTSHVVMRSDTLIGFGLPRNHVRCLDMTDANPDKPAQTWECNGANPNQKFGWLGHASDKFMRLNWSDSNKCLAVGGENYSVGIKMVGNFQVGQALIWRDCNEHDWTQMWGWKNLPLQHADAAQ